MLESFKLFRRKKSINTLFVLLLGVPTFAQSIGNAKLNNKTYSTCRIFDKNNKLLKCSQIERSRYVHYQKFKRSCEQKAGKYQKFTEYGQCPNFALAQCEARGGYVKIKPSDYFYYKLKSIRKVRDNCIQSYRHWVNFSPDDDLKFKYEKSKSKFSTCLKYRDFKLISCEQKTISDFEDYKNNFQNCVLNPWGETYYQFLTKAICPQKNIYFQCKVKGSNSYFYNTFKFASKKKLEKNCLDQKRSGLVEKPATDNIETLACKLYTKGKLSICRNSEVKDNKMDKIIESCTKLPQTYSDRVSLEPNTLCPKKEGMFQCQLNGHEYHIYHEDKRVLTRFKKICR